MKKKASLPENQRSSSDGRVSREDWIQAGLDRLANDGINAVRVEPLAAELGVTKGSFYWHFRDRAELYDAMLEAWRSRNTENLITMVEARGGTGMDRLRYLVELSTSNPIAPRLATAIRVWSASSATVAEALTEIEQRRLDYVTRLLTEAGLDADSARLRAKFLYLALIGSFFAERSSVLEPNAELWREFMETMVVQWTG